MKETGSVLRFPMAESVLGPLAATLGLHPGCLGALHCATRLSGVALQPVTASRL